MPDNIYISIGENYSYPRQIFTEISVFVNDRVFPVEGWQDFSYSMLSSWAYAMTDSTYRPRKIELPFFDGDHLIKAYIDEQDEMILSCISCGKEVCTAHIAFEDYLKDIRRALRTLQNRLAEDPGELSYDSWNNDIDCNVKKIDQYLKVLKK